VAKTKTPFFGLGAQGSVGESITAQRRNRTTLLREKPFPTDPYSLPQAYQRWLYQDYAYLWTQQSAATRAEYRTGGSRFHLTAFQYWMKVMLATLPDIAGWWRFDSLSAGLTPDSSKNANTGTVIGAFITPGLIAQALSFDGINDKVSCGNDPSILIDTWSIEAFVKLADKAQQHLICWATDIPCVSVSWATNPLIYMGANYMRYFSVAARTTLVDGNWHHVVFQMPGLNEIANSEMYLDGAPVGAITTISTGAPLAKTTVTLCNRLDGAVRQLQGIADEIILRNRMLNATEILRHSLRRYPAQ